MRGKSARKLRLCRPGPNVEVSKRDFIVLLGNGECGGGFWEREVQYRAHLRPLETTSVIYIKAKPWRVKLGLG